MNYNYDLSIIVPGIRNENWVTLYEQSKNACKSHSYEMIFSGPSPLPWQLQGMTNVKYIKELGTPTRALHLATLIAEGKFFTWVADDGWMYEDGIDRALDLLLSVDITKDIITMRYSEGVDHAGNELPKEYWTAKHHGIWFQSVGVDQNWNICCDMMLSAEYYKHLGGLDCRFEHINWNIHDLAFRAQRDGSMIHLSPTMIMNCDWKPGLTEKDSPAIAAHVENDYPLFQELYKDNSRPICIDIENWRDSPIIWERREKVNALNKEAIAARLKI